MKKILTLGDLKNALLIFNKQLLEDNLTNEVITERIKALVGIVGSIEDENKKLVKGINELLLDMAE